MASKLPNGDCLLDHRSPFTAGLVVVTGDATGLRPYPAEPTRNSRCMSGHVSCLMDRGVRSCRGMDDATVETRSDASCCRSLAARCNGATGALGDEASGQDGAQGSVAAQRWLRQLSQAATATVKATATAVATGNVRARVCMRNAVPTADTHMRRGQVQGRIHRRHLPSVIVHAFTNSTSA